MPQSQIVWKRFVFAILIAILATIVRIWPLQILGRQLTWVTFYPAVGFSALYGGFFAGLLTSVLSCFAVTFLWSFLAPQPFIIDLSGWIGMAIFFMTSCMISGMAGALRGAQLRAMNAKAQAEKANLAKSHFLATMSHELRTPLNAILGFSAMMLSDATLTKEQQGNIGIINRSGEYLLNLINDILDMAKIESGRVTIELKVFNLQFLIQDIINMLDIRAKEKGLHLLVDISPNIPQYINSDEEKVRQIIANLVSNAIKFSHHGNVLLRFNVQKNSSFQLLIEVEDSGIGISQEDQKHIFEAFMQVGKLTTQKGTGLGLSIVRKYIEMMGGKIEVESTLNKGSIFRVHLPIKLAEQAEEVSSKSEEFTVIGLMPDEPKYRILIVEDQLENQLLLQQLMEKVGFTVKIAQNGKEALEIFQEYRPHIIWMDRNMPVMDGIEATERIRAMPQGKDVKIIGLTALASKDEREQMQASGIDDFITKPYKPSVLFECMERLLGVRFIRKKTSPDDIDLKLTIPALGVLPQVLRKELADSLVLGNRKNLDKLLHRIEQQDEGLAKVLNYYVHAFNYEPILDALESINKETKDNYK